MAITEPSLALFTDQYELTMAQAYWQSGLRETATFSLYFRHYPPGRAYFVAAGLDDVLSYLENFHFAAGDIAYLRSLGLFDEKFLASLEGLRFSGNVRAMPEGSIFFAEEPVLEVTAPVIEAQLMETFVLNQINLQTILASKASRVVRAARGKEVVDFAARRAHGLDAANKMARAGYLAGFQGTSNLMAGALYGIPTVGTMAHSFITCFTSELDSFRRFAASFPEATTLLVDTYDSLAGTRKALVVAGEMRQRGQQVRSLRLDSGDLLDLSMKARQLLDQAGFAEVRIFASGGLDEFDVDALLRKGAPIDGFGVGTKVGVSADAPTTDSVYKLVSYAGRPVLKLSSKKQTLPGPKQVCRFRDGKGNYAHDIIARADEPPPPGPEPLLQEVMRAGKRLARPPSLQELRRRFQLEFLNLPDRHKNLVAPEMYDVKISGQLENLRQNITSETRQRELPGNGQDG